MTTKTPEELLRPRYLVKTPWPPFNNYQKGDIVTPDKFTGWHPKDYPVIFRELQWWERRSPEEMPEYVKRITKEPKVCKVHKHNVHALNSMGFIDDADFKNRSYINYLPATLEEYTNYITTTPSLPGDNNKNKIMELKEAIETMKAHNEWRRGAETEMVNPKDLGVAIDVLVSHAEQSQPSGGKSAEEILMKHEWLPGGGWTKQNMLSAMEEYASQYAHQQPVQRQLCPKCNGEGKCFEILIPTEYRVCPVCNGDKILYPPISQQPVNDGWVRVEEFDGINEGRLVTFSPAYKETDPMRYRIIDAQFLSTCKDVTHYYRPEPPKK